MTRRRNCWAIDTGTPAEVVDARQAVAREIGRQARNDEERFAAEMLIGEILQTIISRDPQATTIELEATATGWIVHFYLQKAPSTDESLHELRLALSDKCDVPLSVERTDQGVHILVSIPASGRGLTQRRSLWHVACCVLVERARRLLRTPPSRGEETSSLKVP